MIASSNALYLVEMKTRFWGLARLGFCTWSGQYIQYGIQHLTCQRYHHINFLPVQIVIMDAGFYHTRTVSCLRQRSGPLVAEHRLLVIRKLGCSHVSLRIRDAHRANVGQVPSEQRDMTPFIQHQHLSGDVRPHQGAGDRKLSHAIPSH